MGRQIHISDHAVLRYLERVIEIDIEQVRAHMAQEIAAVVGTGAKKLVKGGAVFVLETRPDGGVAVLTVLTNEMRHKRRGAGKRVARSVR